MGVGGNTPLSDIDIAKSWGSWVRDGSGTVGESMLSDDGGEGKELLTGCERGMTLSNITHYASLISYPSPLGKYVLD